VLHQTWVREPGTNVYRLDIFREPHSGDTWICRRDATIRSVKIGVVVCFGAAVLVGEGTTEAVADGRGVDVEVITVVAVWVAVFVNVEVRVGLGVREGVCVGTGVLVGVEVVVGVKVEVDVCEAVEVGV